MGKQRKCQRNGGSGNIDRRYPGNLLLLSPLAQDSMDAILNRWWPEGGAARNFPSRRNVIRLKAKEVNVKDRASPEPPEPEDYATVNSCSDDQYEAALAIFPKSLKRIHLTQLCWERGANEQATVHGQCTSGRYMPVKRFCPIDPRGT